LEEGDGAKVIEVSGLVFPGVEGVNGPKSFSVDLPRTEYVGGLKAVPLRDLMLFQSLVIVVWGVEAIRICNFLLHAGVRF
jgi:hypothetical protein